MRLSWDRKAKEIRGWDHSATSERDLRFSSQVGGRFQLVLLRPVAKAVAEVCECEHGRVHLFGRVSSHRSSGVATVYSLLMSI